MANQSAVKFAYGFSIVLGITTFGFGVLNLLGVPADPDACGRLCGVLKPLHQFLGQAGYDIFIGLTWLILGVFFVLVPVIHAKRQPA